MPYAAFTTAARAQPAAWLPPLPATKKFRGNPNLALAPAQPARGLDPRGARTCAGCPCSSPAIHGELRCPAGQARGQAPHGGRSPGPRTPEGPPQQRPRGRIRLRDARTIHGNDDANASAENRHRRTLLRVSRVDIALDRHQARLPSEPSAHRPPQGAPTSGPTVRFKPSRIDPLNREPTAKSRSSAPFKPFRIDPLNRELDAVPDPEPRPVHRIHDPAHIRQSTRRAAGKKSLPQMNADRPMSRVRDWLNSRVSHRDICVHPRPRFLAS